MKRTKLYSVLFNKCPHCHEGDFFVTKNPYNFSEFTKMHENCPVCGEKYLREIGFFYGSMYVSYGLTVALGVGTYLLCHYIFGLSDLAFLIILSALALLLWTWIFRVARLVWINLFVKYDKNFIRINNKH